VEISVERSARAEAAVEAAFAAMADVHRLMSFHDADSDIGRLNREASRRPVRVHAWTFRVLQTAADLHRRSGGAFDIAVAPVLQSLGLLPEHGGLGPPQPPRGTSGAIALSRGRAVRFRHHGVRIDLGGIAKGFAVDRAIDALRHHGLARGLVNAGGDLVVFGPQPEAIDIRDPRAPRRLLCRVEISNEALASTAPRFDPIASRARAGSAIIDPSTRRPTRAIAGASVRAPTCTIADALTKIVVVAGRSAAAQLDHYRAHALLVGADGDVLATPGWQQRLAA
jgi:thiamine biosynthesis lipoprotein